MGYAKRQSAILAKAQARLQGLQSISPTLNLGNGLTLQDYIALIATADTQLQAQNKALAEADRTRIEFAATEAALSALSSRILSAVVAMYGKDSPEYEMAGGTPPNRSKRAQKSAPASPHSSQAMVEPNVAGAAIANGATLN